jgi:hypothetical protein
MEQVPHDSRGSLTSRIDTVFLDYFFNDDKLNPGSRRPVAPPLIIRRIHDIGAYPEHFPPSITPLCKSHFVESLN